MQLTFTTEDDRIINLDVRIDSRLAVWGCSPSVHQVDGNQSMDDIKAILEVDSGIPMAEQVLVNQNNVVVGCETPSSSLVTLSHIAHYCQGHRGTSRSARWRPGHAAAQAT